MTVRDGVAHGAPAWCSAAGLADVLIVAAGDDALVIEVGATGGVTAEVPANIDPTRRAARVTLDGRRRPRCCPAGGGVLTDLARTILAAEAAGVARECTEQAAEYAKVREQFGRPIATFQAVKHHCANMLVAAEVATAAVWDAARAAAAGGDQLSYTAAIAAALAVPAAVDERAAQHPGARRDRLHLGARRPPATCAGPRPSRPSSTPRPRRGRHRPGPPGRPPGRRDRPPARGRGHPGRGPAGRRAPA